MADETISEKCETLYNKLNTFVESEISRDVTPQISNLNSRIDALEPNLVRVKEVNGNISSISAGGTSTQTFTVPACPSGYSWKYLSTSTGWGTVSSVSLSGTTLTVTLLNVSNSSHDISFSGVLMYYPKTMEAEPHISVSATNPYLLEGEVTDLVVSLVDEFGLPLPNKNVTIGQSVFLDDGTTASHNDHWYINSYGTATVQSNGTKLLNTNESGNFVMRSIIPSDKTITEANTYSYNPPYIVEFDIVETDATTSSQDAQVQIYSQQTNTALGQPLTSGHYKIEVKEDEQKIWIDDTLIKTTNLSLPNARITLRVRKGKYLIYKNFVVYEIINGVTDAKGEFALYDISDDTIFTASYGTETATCLVEYCRFVDYAVKDKHNHNYFNQQGTSNVTITEADSYKEFKTIGAIGCNVYIGSSTSYTGFDVGDTWTIIWDKLYIDGYNVGFQCYNGSTTVGINSTTLGLHNSDFQELKFVCDGSSIKAYVDGVYKTQTSYTSTGHGYLRINLNNNNGASQVTFRAKNIRIK